MQSFLDSGIATRWGFRNAGRFLLSMLRYNRPGANFVPVIVSVVPTVLALSGLVSGWSLQIWVAGISVQLVSRLFANVRPRVGGGVGVLTSGMVASVYSAMEDEAVWP